MFKWLGCPSFLTIPYIASYDSVYFDLHRCYRVITEADVHLYPHKYDLSPDSRRPLII
jgi:hypothetical protein